MMKIRSKETTSASLIRDLSDEPLTTLQSRPLTSSQRQKFDLCC